jgi:hypothetical protein
MGEKKVRLVHGILPNLGVERAFCERLDDPRVERTRLHRLIDILVIALCAVICGAESWDDIAEFGEVKQDWFATFLEVPNGIPSHDTFHRVFAALNPEQFRQALSPLDAVSVASLACTGHGHGWQDGTPLA